VLGSSLGGGKGMPGKREHTSKIINIKYVDKDNETSNIKGFFFKNKPGHKDRKHKKHEKTRNNH
jgi:hypothetical protein